MQCRRIAEHRRTHQARAAVTDDSRYETAYTCTVTVRVSYGAAGVVHVRSRSRTAYRSRLSDVKESPSRIGHRRAGRPAESRRPCVGPDVLRGHVDGDAVIRVRAAAKPPTLVTYDNAAVAAAAAAAAA